MLTNLELIKKAEELIQAAIQEKMNKVDGIGSTPVLETLERHELVHQAMGLNEALSILDELKIKVFQ